MKSVRIYKDDIRTHILRSLFFTDTVLVVTGSIIIAVALYAVFAYGLHFFNWSYYLSALFVGIIFFISFITQKIDNQPIYKIVPRAFTFKSSKKEKRYTDLENYFTDFSVQDNHIIRKNSVIRIYEIEPHDIALLNDQDREHFFVKLKQTIHILPTQIQFIVKKEKAKTTDFSKHIFSLYKNSDKKRESLIKQYTNELNTVITSSNFMMTKHYAVLYVQCQTHNPHSKIEAIKKLNDLGLRFASGLSFCNVSIKPLSNEELVIFAREILR